MKKISKSGKVEPKNVTKPWGNEIIYAKTDSYVGKVLNIKAGQRLSWQYHEKKQETIFVLNGTMKLILEDDVVIMNVGDAFHIEPGTKHRFEGLTEDATVLEVSTPHLDDVIRLSDDYGRK